MRIRLYFGHPVNTYGTPLERDLLTRIAEAFPLWDIENPNQPKHDAKYKEWEKDGLGGMNYFKQRVLPDCHRGIFLPFVDGKWGAGIYKEAKFFVIQDLPIWVITPEGFIRDVDLNAVHPLSIEETRSRIRSKEGKIIPYE